MARHVIPLRERRIDLLIMAFFALNLIVISYVVDLEQLVIANPAHFTYPLWPPGFMIDATHNYAKAFDHLQYARPVWWKVTIWIDDLCFGPFYAIALYAYTKGKDWIRLPSIMYSTALLTEVIIILGEEAAGPYASPNFPIVFLANLPWLVFPILIIARMYHAERPFTRASAPRAESVSPAALGGSQA